MAMTLVVTSNVAPRFRGFLASVMLEIAPGVYTGPRMTKAVRERVWTTLEDWFDALHGAGGRTGKQVSIVMTWRDKTAAGGQSVSVLGLPRRELVEIDGLLLVRRENKSKTTTCHHAGL